MSNTLILRLCAIFFLVYGGYKLLYVDDPVYGFGYLSLGTGMAVFAEVYKKRGVKRCV